MKLLFAALVAFSCLSAAAQAPQPPEVAARAYLLMDVTANQILASKDMDMAVEPASLTKLMSAYLVFDALRTKKIDLKQTLPVSERAWKMPGSRMFIDPKMQVPVEDLIQPGNEVEKVLIRVQAQSDTEYIIMLVRPYSLPVYRYVRREVLRRGILTGFDVVNADVKLDWQAEARKLRLRL